MDEQAFTLTYNATCFWWIMRLSILVPGFFAASGAFCMTLNSSPRSEIFRRVSQSKDRRKVEDRLAEVGRSGIGDFEKFRTKQLMTSLIPGLLTFLASFLLGKAIILATIFGGVIATIIYILTDKNLTSQVKKQRLLIDSEFPAIIEMYTLAISAGESPLSAMERISKRGRGSIANQFAMAVQLVKTGKPFHLALDEMSRGLDSLLIRRFVDSLIIATLRGAPVIEVLQRHAQEARESERNRVLGAAAKAEIAMMIPVVFLILPISILFALWPSLNNLNIFAGS